MSSFQLPSLRDLMVPPVSQILPLQLPQIPAAAQPPPAAAQAAMHVFEQTIFLPNANLQTHQFYNISLDPSSSEFRMATTQIQEPSPLPSPKIAQSKQMFILKNNGTTKRIQFADTKEKVLNVSANWRCAQCNKSRADAKEIRRGPDGKRSLCNKCGIAYAKALKRAQAVQERMGIDRLLTSDEEVQYTLENH